MWSCHIDCEKLLIMEDTRMIGKVVHDCINQTQSVCGNDWSSGIIVIRYELLTRVLAPAFVSRTLC